MFIYWVNPYKNWMIPKNTEKHFDAFVKACTDSILYYSNVIFSTIKTKNDQYLYLYRK